MFGCKIFTQRTAQILQFSQVYNTAETRNSAYAGIEYPNNRKPVRFGHTYHKNNRLPCFGKPGPDIDD